MEDMEDSERHRDRRGRVVKDQGPGLPTAHHVVDLGVGQLLFNTWNCKMELDQTLALIHIMYWAILYGRSCCDAQHSIP